ncbi:MAG: hypothetical protein DMG69_17210 [Acidobacteria bacterium]|nr:MAG: hypothetical protein DMG69_17210 [Acidobacteriota bacterium]
MKPVVALLVFAAIALAKAAGAVDTCDSAAAKKNVAWAKSRPHSWLADVEHKQDVEVPRNWCHIWETHGVDRLQKTIDFGRVLFTGDGLHPSVGGIVPGSGFAGGLTYNLERASESLPLRYSGSVEARGSYNRFWVAGGKVDIWGSGNSRDDRHIHATLELEHYELPQLSYFGLGNDSLLANKSLFGLYQTIGGGHIEVPLPAGLFIAGDLAGMHNSPSGMHGVLSPTLFTPLNTPALGVDTTYLVAGGGIDWIHPVSPRSQGFSSSLATGYRLFHATSGPYSFRRLDAIWQNRYNPATKADLGNISATIRFVEAYAPAGNKMPFYLQPTIGGTDINNVDVLRSYADYRFRAPNLLTLQAEYEHIIWGPFALLGFYDVGRMAEQRSDIEIGHVRHSFGAGLILQLGGLPVVKFYYARAGEGTHTAYTLNTNNFTFSTPAGVF